MPEVIIHSRPVVECTLYWRICLAFRALKGGDRECRGKLCGPRAGWRVLHFAAAGGQLASCQYLVAHGADLKHVDALGRCAAVVAP